MLNEKQIAELGKPFDLKEHGFVQKNPYILKSAIRNRLNRIAPGWRLGAPELLTVDGDVVVMRGAMSIGDITRYGVGTGAILRADSDGAVFTGTKLMAQIAKAYKSAASDILPRAALEFGIGEYLKDKPKGIKEPDFAAWLTKLTADPNAWTADNTLEWLRKQRSSGLTDKDLMKALNITEKWSDFRGTVAEADKAVEAFRGLQSSFTPAAAVDLKKLYGTRTVLECDSKDLAPGDIIICNRSGAITYDEVTSIPVRGTGTFPWSVTVKHLETGDSETLQLGGIAYNNLAGGPKVKAYMDNPRLAHEPAHGVTPKWNPQPAQPMKQTLPVIRCETRDLDTGDIILQHSKTQSAETRIEVIKYWGQLAVGQFKLTLKYLATGEEKSVIWSNSEHQLVDGPKCKAYAADESVCLKKPGSMYPIWTAVRASV